MTLLQIRIVVFLITPSIPCPLRTIARYTTHTRSFSDTINSTLHKVNMSAFESEEAPPLYSVNSAHEPLLSPKHSITTTTQDAATLPEGPGHFDDDLTAANPTTLGKKRICKPLSTLPCS